MRKITVFCSSSDKIDPDFYAAVGEFVEGLAARSWELIYGGAKCGLMGHFADQMLLQGGIVRGVMPTCISEAREVSHTGLSEMHIVQDLMERKKIMMEVGDAFVIFPGGFGTLDEALEVITWKMLDLHRKPIVFVNLKGFWQNQISTFNELAGRGMIHSTALKLYDVCSDVSSTFKILDQVT